MTSCGQVAVLPCESVAVQITVLVPTGKIAGALLDTVTTPQLSEKVGVPSVTLVAPQRPGEATTVTRAGQVIEGGWLSVTITSCGQVAVLPCESVAVQITVLVPTENIAGALLVTVTAPQLSETVGVPSVTLVAPQRPGEAKTVTSAGQVMEGGWLSVTITSCGQVAVLPCESVAVQITVLVPTGKIAGALLDTVTTPQLSEKVGVPSVTLVAPQRPGEATTVTSAGQVIEGGWLSVTITSCGQVAVLPCESVAVQITVFVPTGNIAGALLFTVTVPQLSETVGVLSVTLVAPHRPGEATTVTRVGQVTEGGWLSVTITSCGQVAVLP